MSTKKQLIELLIQELTELKASHEQLKAIVEKQQLPNEQQSNQKNVTQSKQEWIILSEISKDPKKDSNKNYVIERQRLKEHGFCYWDVDKKTAEQNGKFILEGVKFAFLTNRNDDSEKMEMFIIIGSAEPPSHWNRPDRSCFQLKPLKLPQWSFKYYIRVRGGSQDVVINGTRKLKWVDPFSS